MTDQRIDALIQRLDMSYEPDPRFVDATLDALAPRVRHARRRDARAVGRFWARISSQPVWAFGRPRLTGLRTAVLITALLILALMTAIAFGGALRRPPFGNGALVVSHGGDLLAIDAGTMDVRATLHDSGPIAGLARSPDGRSMSFWTGPSPGSRFEVANVDGSERRQLASTLAISRGGCADDWSPDSTRVATEVIDTGRSRVLVADVRTGEATFVTSMAEIAHCPLWSPDGQLIAFQRDLSDGTSALAVITPDGSGLREVSGDLKGLTAYGANGWSPDGAFVYFGAGRGSLAEILRANVNTATSQRLTAIDLEAHAPTVSPNGALVSFIVWTGRWWDLHVMRSDGTAEHRLLEHATNWGWSPDGRYVVAEWHGSSPQAANGGLISITPDGTEQRVLLLFGWTCATNTANDQPRCLDGASWGEPVP